MKSIESLWKKKNWIKRYSYKNIDKSVSIDKHYNVLIWQFSIDYVVI